MSVIRKQNIKDKDYKRIIISTLGNSVGKQAFWNNIVREQSDKTSHKFKSKFSFTGPLIEIHITELVQHEPTMNKNVSYNTIHIRKKWENVSTGKGRGFFIKRKCTLINKQ